MEFKNKKSKNEPMINCVGGTWKILNYDCSRMVFLHKCPYDLTPLYRFDGKAQIIVEQGVEVTKCGKCNKLFKLFFEPEGYTAFVREESLSEIESARFKKPMTNSELRDLIKKSHTKTEAEEIIKMFGLEAK